MKVTVRGRIIATIERLHNLGLRPTSILLHSGLYRDLIVELLDISDASLTYDTKTIRVSSFHDLPIVVADNTTGTKSGIGLTIEAEDTE